MSTHSSFIILKQDIKNKQYIDDVRNAYRYSHFTPNQPNELNQNYTENDIPAFIECDRLKYVNHFKREIYDVILTTEFNSSFDMLIHEFGINAYGPKINVEIKVPVAEKMLEAINYLLNEDYDRKMESLVLSNDYIKLFGESYAPYYNYYASLVTNNDENLLEYDDTYDTYKCIFKRVRTVFSTFLLMNDEGKINDLQYVLIYEVC